MLFHSAQFLVFFPLVVLAYGLLPRRWRGPWLLVASYYFYMSWNARYAVLIALSTLVTWAGGLFLDLAPRPGPERAGAGEKRPRGRMLVLAAVFAVNLGILFFFKYFNLALDALNRVLGLFGGGALERPFDVLLPVGISFYTFQALGYCADVYRGRVPAERDLLRYALFVSFFPQLVAGPIERSHNLLGQIDDIENIHVWDYDRIASGLALMLWGFFQKLMIADRLALVADTVFAEPAGYGTTALAAGALAFSLQIYCDFGAYSNIAVGAARVMGFRLMDNFDTPYFALGISDFWHRWHISLSTWFRDYVYIPLGGNRRGRGRKYVNLLVTFAASGLWHGANWTFLLWGAVHGILQILEDLLRAPLCRLGDALRVDRGAQSYRWGRMAVSFVLVTLAWVFFRAEAVGDAFSYLGRLFTRPDPWNLFNESLYTLGLDHFEAHVLLVSLALLFLVDLLRVRRREELWDFLVRQNLWFRWGFLIAMLVAILVYGTYGVRFDSTQFIYFTF